MGSAVPKRIDQRLGHMTKAEKAAVTKVETVGDVEVPPADEGWHEIARDWYESLPKSGQSRFYEPSDWAAARYVAAAITKTIDHGRFSANSFAAIWSAMGDLLTTEGERRRVKLEVERKPAKPQGEPGKVARLDDYRDL